MSNGQSSWLGIVLQSQGDGWRDTCQRQEGRGCSVFGQRSVSLSRAGWIPGAAEPKPSCAVQIWSQSGLTVTKQGETAASVLQTPSAWNRGFDAARSAVSSGSRSGGSREEQRVPLGKRSGQRSDFSQMRAGKVEAD